MFDKFKSMSVMVYFSFLKKSSYTPLSESLS